MVSPNYIIDQAAITLSERKGRETLMSPASVAYNVLVLSLSALEHTAVERALMETEALTKKKLHALLDELKASREEYLTLYMKPACFPHYISEVSLAARYRPCLDEIGESAKDRAVIQSAQKYGTGTVIFWQPNGKKYIVLPPFPISENMVSIGEPCVSPLCQILEREYAIGVVLVRWGSYAIGIFRGESLIESKVGTGHIHKEHKKGGSSQKRFARRTEEQKKDFLRRVGNRIDERFRNHTLDYIFFGGNRLILKPLSEESKCLQSQTSHICGRLLDVRGRPDSQALISGLREINTSLAFCY